MTTMKIKVEVSVEPPSVPNFIKTGLSGSASMVSISQFTAPQLEEIGELWTKALIERAKQIRKNNSES